MPYTLARRTGQNQYYEEPLAMGVMPLRMMRIPAGSFLMGSPPEELGRMEREGPQHEVTLGQFFMAKYPVTQAQWRAVAAMEPVETELKSDPSRFKGDLHPVEQVSWHEAVEFCERLSRHTQRQYRLPSEAEWEYACRAGTTTPFHFGETVTTEMANYRGTALGQYSGSYGDGPKGEYREATTPVNQFEGANAFGLVDMHGNVWEWCQDCWHDSYKGAPEDGSVWEEKESEEESRRVIRGGSWGYYPENCRSAVRIIDRPGNRVNLIGFRVVCSAPRSLQ